VEEKEHWAGNASSVGNSIIAKSEWMKPVRSTGITWILYGKWSKVSYKKIWQMLLANDSQGAHQRQLETGSGKPRLHLVQVYGAHLF
jgi:hypothetical protein